MTHPRLTLAVLLPLAWGCQTMRLAALAPTTDARAKASESAPPAPTPTASSDKPSKPKDPADEEVDGWNAWAAVPPTDPAEGYRWRHTGLEAVIARQPDERPDFASLLASENDIVAANAAISLSRLGDERGRELLVRTVRNPKLRVPLRAAAAEALAGFVDTPATAELGEFEDS